MAKKKSKTQKYKKNQKKKIQKKQTNTKRIENSQKNEPKTIKEKQLVPKEKVKYNVVLTETKPKKEQKTESKKTELVQVQKKKTETQKKTTPKKENKIVNIIKEKISVAKNKKAPKQTKKFEKNNIIQKKKVSHKIEKEIKKAIPKTKTEQEIKKKNIFIRLFYELKKNMHIIFNTILIVTFIILLIGLIRIHVFKSGTIIYICCILIFLMLVAMSYNKYISGKIFTLLITAGMTVGIYYMQYTYDFIRNLNSNVYEYKTYYVVAFDTTINRSIYTINNKKVGLLKENCINIERKLNTKLDKVNYIEYDDINNLFKDFYDSKFKAILVNENQYNYLKNNIEENSRDVKILYEFQVNAKK